MSQPNLRYPGIHPYRRDQSDRFFGREQEGVRLLSLILQEKLCVLHSKSGNGKSSLLNAWILPRLDEESIKGKRRYVAVSIRFLAASEKIDTSPYKQFSDDLNRAMVQAGFRKTTELVDLPNTLWACFKKWEIEPNTVFVLLFDQFEELFTYTAEQQLIFRQQLAELLYSDYPHFLEENDTQLPPEIVDRLAKKINVQSVLAIRSDRISELDQLRDHLPKIREKWFELRPLSIKEADEVLTIPAGLKGDFDSPTFQFDKDAQEKILEFLPDKDGFVYPNKLQILLQSFEKRVMEEGLVTLSADDIGDLQDIIDRYYDDRIAAIADPDERRAAQCLCEEGLAQEGDPPLRLSLHAAQVEKIYQIKLPLLTRLVKDGLLRAEAGKSGGTMYELPHDTLLKTVLEAKEKRLKAEQEAKEKREAEELARRVAEAEDKVAVEKKRRQRALLLAWGAALAAVLAVYYASKAKEATQEANSALQSALQEQISRYRIEIKTSERKIGVYDKANEADLADFEKAQLENLKARLESANSKLKTLKQQ
jgi:hypothetical protein